MRILALETSSSVSAVALADGERVIAEDDTPSETKHGETLLPRIRALLDEAGWSLQQLELIATGVGPGSFTGLRVGLATAKGLALATGVPIRGVSSLRVLARGAAAAGNAQPGQRLLTWLDAYRGEVFGAVYTLVDGGDLEELLAPFHAEPELASARVTDAAAGALVCGDGLIRYPALCEPWHRPPDCDYPRGRHVAAEALARFRAGGPSDLASLEPAYLRDSDAKLPDVPLAT